MGGLGPGIGGLEVLVIGLVALLVVGPKDLPVLMRKVGKAMARARGMANEFRASFDEMARQSELDELRKEVEALRQGQTLHPLGAEADAAFRDISSDLNKPLIAPGSATPPMPALTGPEEWPESLTAERPAAALPAPVTAKAARKPRATAATAGVKAPPKARARKKAPEL